ncbi:N-6 DNA methylase [Aeromonas sp. 5HA1]|uniref:N-6 DNA methylase n=1 Tax=Aeromonas sp. 5HA1 TaxID=2699197 RepID=UPI0023DDA699|nr:N-6 DNA methylase [Aeromonas sp. 5HA1]MDF2401094.1 N-6 DNA methylase [Aeromonas sp. 5HA1]
MIDIHYTPSELAQTMIECIPSSFTPSTIADFSAGEGSLLNEAAKRWPFAMVFANDLNKTSSRMLASLNKLWSVSCSDFLKSTSHTNTKFSSKKGGVDLILLNPPFSERGRKPIEWFEQPSIKSGLATRFVSLSLNYLSLNGYMLAILPNGSLNSERDSHGWSEIKKRYSVEIMATNPLHTFKNAAARTSIVLIRHKLANDFDEVDEFPLEKPAYRFVRRGRVQMHSFKSNANGYPLIHTTELTNGKVIINGTNILVMSSIIVRGPALLFPRVGMVTHEKICILANNVAVVLSDCVLAIEFQEMIRAVNTREYLLRDWLNFSNIYNGTGAKYTTIKKTEAYFQGVIS